MTESRTALTLEAIDELERRDVNYCVLRNFEFLDGEDIDGDVDILVPESDHKTADAALRDLGYRRGRGDTSRQTTYLTFHVPSRRLLVLDLYWDAPTYNGLPILDGERTLNRARRHEGVRVPCDEDLFVELLFHGALNKNGYRAEYEATLRDLAERVSKRAVLAHANKVFGRLGRSVAKAALDGNLDRAVRLKWPLVAAALRERPSLVRRFVWDLIVRRELVLPLERLAHTYDPLDSGAVIALLGPDGSGKTTVAKEVSSVLRASGFQVTEANLGTYNDRSWPLALTVGTLERVGRWLGQLVRTGDDSTVGRADDCSDGDAGYADEPPSESLPPKRPRWKALVHIADISIRYLEARLGTRGVIVADRFVHDIVAYDAFDTPPERLFGLYESGAFTGIVLTGDAETLAARSEYDRESVERMLTDFDRLDLTQVDATQDVEAVVDDVLEESFDDGEILAYSDYVR